MGRGGTSRTSLDGEPENNRIIENEGCCSRRPSSGWEWCGGGRPAVALSEFEAPAAGSLVSACGPDWGCVCGGVGVVLGSPGHIGGADLISFPRHPPPPSPPLTSLGPRPAFSKQEEGTLAILWSCPVSLADGDPEALRQYNDERYTLKGQTRAQWPDFALENWPHYTKKLKFFKGTFLQPRPLHFALRRRGSAWRRPQPHECLRVLSTKSSFTDGHSFIHQPSLRLSYSLWSPTQVSSPERPARLTKSP